MERKYLILRGIMKVKEPPYLKRVSKQSHLRIFVKKILEKISLIEQTSEENRGDIKKKERIFNELQNIPEYQSVMQIADLNTSFYFGNKIENTKNRLAASFYYDLIGSMYTLDSQWWKRTQSMRGLRMPLRWVKKNRSSIGNLNIPEIFFDTGKLSENPGWDAVIGNPPWEKISAKSSKTFPRYKISIDSRGGN